ncbi:CRP/FNR family transcriptional regulator, anaerobic regulatory protein [Gracilibacillus ureilyticus]|uniref:CRP/FNR family transcriptional regulator, anaerobic regulatory protein n=1 Tax=Gracilibacillus ureilyticus TaxID=531814 RepID=A0A1H9LHK1_9BACI|nr:Crp/Fnr family transcriptional regulator [Gracilibacillus ureilyticus]SER10595.1 CRP/FNR family transcriptional regulator, anaerobic regulatory protein [Gracilibacillus ureilyticus]
MCTHCHTHHHHLTGIQKNCVSLVPIFNHLENRQLNEVMNKMNSVSYKKGETIYHAGDQSDTLYIVNNGKIKIYRLAESGKEQFIRLLNQGEFTGEYALFSESIHESYAEAVTDTNVCLMKRSDLQELLIKYPTISLKILSVFSDRLEHSEKQTTLFATEKAETRIAFFLVQTLEDTPSSEVMFPMNKKDLASYLGTTPETISRKLTHLESRGYIKQKSNKRIEVLDINGLLLV